MADDWVSRSRGNPDPRGRLMGKLEEATCEHLDLSLINGAKGAEIRGVDISTNVRNEAVAEGRQTWRRHLGA